MQRVAVVGGTHGNEWGGIYLCRQWQRMPHRWQHLPFQVEFYLANPRAIELNRRYVDKDLNRCFRLEDLNNPALTSYEDQRAKAIAQDLGGVDFLIDLHNTTAHMGLTLILSHEKALEDPLTRQLCAHLLQQDEQVRLYYMPHPRGQSPYLPSIAQRELTLEVGPMAHGTLQADLFVRTERLVEAALNFLADWQTGKEQYLTGKIKVFRHLAHLDFPRREDGSLAGMIHPQLQGRDFYPLDPGSPLFYTFEGLTLPYEGHQTVWPVFINEQAYYEKGIALALTHCEAIDL